eukprot:4104353-Ditylum_brightwellii.AAC.1
MDDNGHENEEEDGTTISFSGPTEEILPQSPSLRSKDGKEKLAKSREYFQGGELEGIKEDLGWILTKQKELIFLVNMWRVDDANEILLSLEQ